MPKIRNFTLPQALAEYLAGQAQNMPESLLLDWARECLPGGFKRTDLIRSRLAALFRSEAPLDPTLYLLLSTSFPLRPAIKTLSTEALGELHAAIETLVGREPFLVALLLDPREEVHQMGIELCGKPPAPTGEQAERDAEDEAFVFLVDRLADPLGVDLMVPDEPGPPKELLDSLASAALKETQEKIEAQKRSIERLNNELHQQKLRHTAKLKQYEEQLAAERKKMREQTIVMEPQLASARQEKQAADSKLEELRSQLEARVAARVREETSALVRKWLAAPLETEALARDSEARAGDLLARAERVLEAQARQDLHTGNRRELGKRLESLETARRRLNDALQHATRPVVELKPLLADLDAEVGRIRKVLSGVAPRSELLGRLLAEVNTAAAWEAVRRISSLADQLVENGLLGGGESRELFHAIQRKFSLLQDSQPNKPDEGDNGWSLRDTLFRNKPALLLLDGHNILYTLSDVFGADYDDGHPGQRARQRLAGMVEKLLRDRNNLKAKVCFDGPDARSARVSSNVSVEYSGGAGRDRADEMIVGRLQFKDLQSLDQKVFVVTDDREIRKGVVQTGAKFVRNDLFAVLLADFNCL